MLLQIGKESRLAGRERLDAEVVEALKIGQQAAEHDPLLIPVARPPDQGHGLEQRFQPSRQRARR